MNRSKIEWCDHTWNPITGCRNDCQYCYARRMTARFAGDVRMNKMAKNDYSMVAAADGGNDLFVLEEPMLNETGNALVYPFGFEPTLHKYRMNTLGKLKMGNNIFVGAMSDIFGVWVPDGWIKEVMDICVANPIHNYLFLTKNPQRYTEYGVPTQLKNMWYGTTITNRAEIERFNSLPAFCKTFVSIEPLLEDMQPKECDIMFRQVDWIIIGAETGRRKDKTIPEWEWIRSIVLEADKFGVPVFMKDSLIDIVGENNMRREFPVQLQHKEASKKVKARLEGDCCKCKAHMRKNKMITLSARAKRGEQPKQLGFMCKDCFKSFCIEMNIDMTKLINFKEDE